MMSKSAKAIYNIYKMGVIKKDGVKKSVETGVITADEYFIITGVEYE